MEEIKQNLTPKDIQLVVLMGDVSDELAPISYFQSPCLLSISQKPAIFNVITRLVSQGLNDLIFVVNPFDRNTIKDFVRKTYPNIKTKFIIQRRPHGTLRALQLCTFYLTKPTLLLYGNTVCSFNYDFSESFIGTINKEEGKDFSRNFVVANENNEVERILDNPSYPTMHTTRFAGVFFFDDVSLLKQGLSRIYITERGRDKINLCPLLRYYNSKKTMLVQSVTKWYNSSNLSTYVTALRENLNGRSFNSFKFDNTGIITKHSTEKKLLTEIKWYEDILKTDLRHLCPQFLGSVDAPSGYSYKMEFMEYMSLAEYYTYYPIPEKTWLFIFENLLEVARKMWLHAKPPAEYDIAAGAQEIYINKTIARIKKWERQDLMNLDYVYINGKKYEGFNKCWAKLKDRLNSLSESSKNYSGIIHGDLCFSNILYAPKSSTFKFIDPRGEFGTPGLYGDIRYDVAKMRHNYHGLYDFITNDLFTIQETKNGIQYKFFSDSFPAYFAFDDLLLNYGFDVDDIELIEGLLFISMIPLHADSKTRQLMYFATAIKCFNSQIQKII